MTDTKQPILVVVCGNDSAGDDAFGPAVAAHLQRFELTGVRILDLGIKPDGVLDHLAGNAGLIVLDAAVTEKYPVGRIIDLPWSPQGPSLFERGVRLSSHGLSIDEQLALAAALQMLPVRTRVLAVAIDQSLLGQSMCMSVRRAVPQAAERVIRWCAAWRKRDAALSLARSSSHVAGSETSRRLESGTGRSTRSIG